MPPCKLTFDLLTLKVVSESRVTWPTPTSVPILLFLGLSVFDLGQMYATDRQSDVRQTSDAHHRLMSSTVGAGYNSVLSLFVLVCVGVHVCACLCIYHRRRGCNHSGPGEKHTKKNPKRLVQSFLRHPASKMDRFRSLIAEPGRYGTYIQADCISVSC